MCSFLRLLLIILLFSCYSDKLLANPLIQPGADQTSLYLPLLKDKKVGVFVNQSSLVNKEPLVNFLQRSGVRVTSIFTPEHGYDGKIGDGEEVKSSTNKKLGMPIISLYGQHVKPSPAELKNVDVLIFDIQDVGVRFYTYISSLQRFMEAAVENNIPLIILDRPNPNGFYVDGPVLDITKHKNFTGLQPIPIVHGMTIGEYAQMLVGEKWLDVKPSAKNNVLNLTVIRNANYTHKSLYVPPVPPSPNLPTIQSIYWYPAIGLMEGLDISVGRGTDKPFQVFGNPRFTSKYSFVPKARQGAPRPPYINKTCYGWDISGSPEQVLKKVGNQLQIKYYMQAIYALYGEPRTLKKLSRINNNDTVTQIRAGMTEAQIRQSWEPQLSAFKQIRRKYLLYPDFE